MRAVETQRDKKIPRLNSLRGELSHRDLLDDEEEGSTHLLQKVQQIIYMLGGNVSADTAGSRPSQLSKIPDHVHLIEILVCVRDRYPGLSRRFHLHLQRSLKSGNLYKQLRRYACILMETPL